MGFLTRLLSIGGKKRRKYGNNDKNDKSKKHATQSSTTSLLQVPQDQEAVVNRLLRSSSTHFSILSETEYRSLPPIPHPINNVLRAPSIISNATQTDTYTVTVHRRMLHSRTEFPNANRSGDSSPSKSLNRRHSSPHLTPEDRERLLRLRQDPSVLSLLDIYDDSGRPDPQAFSNTPVRREHNNASLRVLLGNPNPSSLNSMSNTRAEESDISWADRYIRTAHRDSTSSRLTTSSLGIPVDLFKSSISPECLWFDQLDINSSSRDMDIDIDSLQVERGTVEDSSMIVHPPMIGLTNPTRRASQFFKFLSEEGGHGSLNSSDLSSSNQPSPHGSLSMKTPMPPTMEDDKTSRHTNTSVLHLRDGPKENRPQVSPAPRRRLQTSLLVSPPPVQSYIQTKNKSVRPKQTPLGHRAPFDELHNASGSSSPMKSRNNSSRSVSVTSSVYPHIERPVVAMDGDLNTPVPPRRVPGGKRGRHSIVGENIPPNAPARPTRGPIRKYTSTSRDCQCSRPARGKENASPSKIDPNEQTACTSIQLSKHDHVPIRATPPTTPLRNPSLVQLRTPSRSSPVSSSELSPEGRQIMTNIRTRAHKLSQSKAMTLRER